MWVRKESRRCPNKTRESKTDRRMETKKKKERDPKRSKTWSFYVCRRIPQWYSGISKKEREEQRKVNIEKRRIRWKKAAEKRRKEERQRNPRGRKRTQFIDDDNDDDDDDDDDWGKDDQKKNQRQAWKRPHFPIKSVQREKEKENKSCTRTQIFAICHFEDKVNLPFFESHLAQKPIFSLLCWWGNVNLCLVIRSSWFAILRFAKIALITQL